jgi:hypothetical protein
LTAVRSDGQGGGSTSPPVSCHHDHASGSSRSCAQRQFKPDIEGLRAIVVVAVVRSAQKVVLLGDTPSPAVGGSVPDCLSINSDDVQRCAIPRSESALSSAARQIEIAGAKKAGATVIDPTPWFCTATECPAVIANTIVYEDNSHITATYGRSLAPELGRALSNAL